MYLKDTIFNDNKDYYDKLKKLHAQKVELERLRNLCKLTKPFVIEFSGTPRTGKTTTINNLYDFFKKGGFDITIIEEFTTSKYYKEEFKQKYSDLSSSDFNIAILKEVTNQLKDIINSGREIILIDRSINDRQIWNYRRYKKGDIDLKTYEELRDKYSLISKKLIDFLVITYADALTSIKRDYNSSLALEQRNFLNKNNIDEYNDSLNNLQELFKNNTDNYLLLDTSLMDINDVAITVADKIMPVMRKKYIDSFKQKYNIK